VLYRRRRRALGRGGYAGSEGSVIAWWYWTEVAFDVDPGEAGRRILTTIYKAADKDAPDVATGLLYPDKRMEGLSWDQWDWRSPSLSLEHILAIPHCLGYPCKGRWARYTAGGFCDKRGCLGCANIDWKSDCYTGCDVDARPRLSTVDQLLATPFTYSKADLSGVDPWMARRLRESTRRLDAWLPAGEKRQRSSRALGGPR